MRALADSMSTVAKAAPATLHFPKTFVWGSATGP
jgi:hypothetical protein